MKKKWVILGVLALLLIVVVVAVFVLYSSLDSIVKSGIERYGSEITGTKVSVGSVEITLETGRGTIRDLRIANPDGYSSGDAFRLGEITVEIDISSLTGSPVVVNSVVIGAPEVAYELNDKAKSNVDMIREHAESFAGGQGSGGDGKGGEGKLIRIRRFVFENGNVAADATAVGVEKTMSVSLPPLELADLGGSKGAPPEEIGKKVATTYATVVTKAVAAKGIERFVDVDAAKDKVKGLLEKSGD